MIARRCGLSPSYWCKMESGRGGRPGDKVLARIKSSENVTSVWLVLGEGKLLAPVERIAAKENRARWAEMDRLVDALDLICEKFWAFSYDDKARAFLQEYMEQMDVSEMEALTSLAETRISKKTGFPFRPEFGYPEVFAEVKREVFAVAKQFTDSREHCQLATDFAKTMNCAPWLAISLMARIALRAKFPKPPPPW